jgi:hypothetical protein
MIPTARLREIERLCAKATPGPWGSSAIEGWNADETERVDLGALVYAEAGPRLRIHVAETKEWKNDPESLHRPYADADFIAACSPDVIASLVRELVAARLVVEAARDLASVPSVYRSASGDTQTYVSLERRRDLERAMQAYDSAAADQQGRGT